MSSLAWPGTAAAAANRSADAGPEWTPRPRRSLVRAMTAALALPAKLVAPWAKRRQQRRAIMALEALSDRLLADIGLQRGEIARVVHHGRDGTDRRAFFHQLD